MKCLWYFVVLSLFLPTLPLAEVTLVEKIDIAKVWAGHPVDFAITTVASHQYVAFYDTTRQMVVAARDLGSDEWEFTKLPTTTGWDSHNYIEMTVDDSGYIHISGNMHNAHSLIYFRSKKPYDISDFTSPGMIGTLEGSITYPVFIKGLAGQLIFQYRDGGSGSGTTIWNAYDLEKKKWNRLTSQGLLDGEGQVNAYQTSPVAGPDGYFHIIWMWRNTPVANTNHHLSHIKSKDLINWETMAGKPLTMPVKQSTSGVVVDPIGSGHGLINMDFWISWDRNDRAVLTYHRYDDSNISQIFNTRWENESWKIHQTSDWTGFKWNLDRQGSLSHDIAATPLSIDEQGKLVQNYVYRNTEVRQWVLDEETLVPLSDGVYEPPEAMEELYRVESSFNGIQVNQKRDGEYYLRWETMPINQDNARPAGTYPSSSALRLYRFSSATSRSANRQLITNAHGFSIEKNRYRIVISRSPVSIDLSACSAALYSIDGRCITVQAFQTAGCCVLPISKMSKGIYLLRIAVDRQNSDSDIITFCERIALY